MCGDQGVCHNCCDGNCHHDYCGALIRAARENIAYTFPDIAEVDDADDEVDEVDDVDDVDEVDEVDEVDADDADDADDEDDDDDEEQYTPYQWYLVWFITVGSLSTFSQIIDDARRTRENYIIFNQEYTEAFLPPCPFDDGADERNWWNKFGMHYAIALARHYSCKSIWANPAEYYDIWFEEVGHSMTPEEITFEVRLIPTDEEDEWMHFVPNCLFKDISGDDLNYYNKYVSPCILTLVREFAGLSPF